jgi:hypothetical protein
MQDEPISGLGAANLPLTGTELIVLVQDGVTKKTGLDNLPEQLDSNEIAAVQNANAPTGVNPFATIDDLSINGVFYPSDNSTYSANITTPAGGYGQYFVSGKTMILGVGFQQVDLDFDAGYRLITGLDSIIQTAGRINRNHRPSSSPLTIFDLENCERLPSDRQRILYTQKKLEDLQKQNKIQALDQEENCSGYFKTLFTAKHTQSSNQVNNFDEEDINSKRLNYEFKKVSEAFNLIEENNKIDVIITRDRRASELINKLKSDNFLNQKEWRELYQYSVSVTTAIAQAKGEIINQNVCLWKGDYDQSLGLISTN